MQNPLLKTLVVGLILFSTYIPKDLYSQTPNIILNPIIKDGSFDGIVNAISQSITSENTQIIVGGDFTTVNTKNAVNIARLNTNGTLDETFNTGTGFNNPVYATAVQTDGKIIVGGDFTTFNGASKSYLIRLNSNGSIDNTFNSAGSGANNIIRAITIQSDGRILVSGNFTTFNSVDRGRIVRLNTDGSVDNTFNASTGASGTVRSIAVQSDGKVVIVGSFATYKGTVVNNITRLNTDGTIDNTFISTGTNATVNFATVMGPNIYITGSFTTYNGITIKAVAAINSLDGSLSNSFTSTIGITGPLSVTGIPSVLSIIPANEGKFLIAGDFNTYNNTSLKRIAKLNTDGSVTSPISYADGSNHIINVMTQIGDYIYLGGRFTSFEGQNRSGLARLFSPVLITALEDLTKDAGINVVVYPNPIVNDLLKVKIERENDDIFEYAIFDVLGKEILKQTAGNQDFELNLANQAKGAYYLKMVFKDETIIKKIIKN